MVRSTAIPSSLFTHHLSRIRTTPHYTVPDILLEMSTRIGGDAVYTDYEPWKRSVRNAPNNGGESVLMKFSTSRGDHVEITIPCNDMINLARWTSEIFLARQKEREEGWSARLIKENRDIVSWNNYRKKCNLSRQISSDFFIDETTGRAIAESRNNYSRQSASKII